MYITFVTGQKGDKDCFVSRTTSGAIRRKKTSNLFVAIGTHENKTRKKIVVRSLVWLRGNQTENPNPTLIVDKQKKKKHKRHFDIFLQGKN